MGNKHVIAVIKAEPGEGERSQRTEEVSSRIFWSILAVSTPIFHRLSGQAVSNLLHPSSPLVKSKSFIETQTHHFSSPYSLHCSVDEGWNFKIIINVIEPFLGAASPSLSLAPHSR
jgi:hypothetical protein